MNSGPCFPPPAPSAQALGCWDVKVDEQSRFLSSALEMYIGDNTQPDENWPLKPHCNV